MWNVGIRRILCLLFLCGNLPGAQTPVPPGDLPAAAGVYYRQGESAWTALGRAVMADTRTKGMERFLDTYGWSNLSRTIVFQGAKSTLQIPGARPEFYVRGSGAARDVLIVQLTRKKETREIEAASTNASVNNKEGFKRGSICRVSTTPLAKDLYIVTPDEDLRPGEYLLVIGHVDSAFEFGVQAAPR